MNYKKLEKLIGYCYEKYKEKFTDIERENCELYLYEQGEYGEALTNLIAILEDYKIVLDQESKDKINEAKKLMSLS